MPGLLSAQQRGPIVSSPEEERAEGPAGHNPAEEAQEAQPGGGDGDVEGEQPNVSPEEQAQYDEFMDRAFRLVYDERAFPKILERLTATPDPVEGLAAVVVMVVTRLRDSAKQQGVEIGPDVLFHGGSELLEDLASTAEKAGVHRYTPQEIEKALYRALDLYRTMEQQQGGGDRQAFEQDWNTLVEADRQGRLGDILPQLGQRGGQRAPEQQGGPPPRRGLLGPAQPQPQMQQGGR